MFRPSLFVLAVATVALVGLGATPALAKTAGPPLKVMVIYDASGAISAPELPQGALAAAKALNKRNGIGGRKVKVLLCDAHNDPNASADCGRKAVSSGVVALVGVLEVNSGQFMPLMAANKIPSIGNDPNTSDDFLGASSFPMTGGSVANTGNLARLLADDGAKAITLVVPDVSAAAALPTLANATLAKVGQKLTNTVPVPLDAPDMSVYAASALTHGSDGIVVALPAQQAINFVQAARQANAKVKLALISTEPGPVAKALGAGAAGIIQAPSIVPPLSVPTKTGKRYLKEMKAAGYKEFTGFRLNSWLAMQVLAKVATGLPTVTATALFDKLNTTTGLVTGLTPPLQWTTPAKIGLPLTRVFNTCGYGVKMNKSGKVKPLTGKFFDAFANKECPTP